MTRADPLADLRVRFLKRSLEDADTLVDALRNADMARVEAVAHGLAGSAGVFRFQEIGQAALAIDGLFASGGEPSTDQVKALIDAIRSTYS